MKYKTALVTGGAGFVGSHLADALIRRHIKTYVVDDLSAGSRKNVNPNATFFKMSILSPNFPKLIKKLKPDVIFHVAAMIDVRCSVQDPPVDANVNVLGTVHLAHAAGQAGVKKIIFSSSGGAIYPETGRPPFSEKTIPHPISPYGVSKRAAEMYLDYEHHVHGMPYVALRYANVYGPRQRSSKNGGGVVAIFTDRFLRGEQISINGTGDQTRDYVFVEDVVRANLLAMTRNVNGIFNIGTGRETSVNTIFRKLKKILGSEMPERHVPSCPGEVMRNALDCRKARKELGWEPAVTLDEGLRKTAEWMGKHGKTR